MSNGDKVRSLGPNTQAMDDSASQQTGATFHTISQVPKVIGKYDIDKAVGKGSMGTVYSAYDSFSNRTVAIKVAHPQYINQTEDGSRFRKLFFNEAHDAAVLAKTDVSLIRVNAATLDRADGSTQLCFLKVFVETVTERLKQTTSILTQLRQI